MKTAYTLTTALLLACCALTCEAQTVTPVQATDQLVQIVIDNFATNLAVEPYLTYAKNDAHKHIGGGLLLAYNFNNYAAAGAGVDYLGQFTMVSANLQFKLPLYPLKSLGTNSFFQNFMVAPFAITGVGTPMSGAPTGAVTIEDVGGYFEYGHFLGGRFNTGVAWGQWNNAGAYSGKRYHIFAGWSKNF
jgi:hypothetical protein